MRLLMTLGLSLCLTGCAASHDGRAATGGTIQVVEQLERGLVLPEGAEALNLYARAWWMEGDVLVGLLVKPEYVEGLKAGRRLLPSAAPYDVLDGGCGVIRVRADVASGRITEVRCNGES